MLLMLLMLVVLVAGTRSLPQCTRLMQTLFITLLRLYQLFISPCFGNCCRFYPSCSDYACQAIQYHGIVRGTYFTVKRICRCHPFSAGGIDLVPQSKKPS